MNQLTTTDTGKGVSSTGDASFAIIVAAGSGRRAGGGLPKQFREIADAPVFIHSVRAFVRAVPGIEIIVVTHPDYRDLAREALSQEAAKKPFAFRLVDGGATRTESVMAGLATIPAEADGIVFVHDGARPSLTKKMIVDGREVAEVNGAAIPVVPVTDSLRFLDDRGESRTVDRSCYRAVQTPQVFELSLLRKAYSRAVDADSDRFTDDASVVEAAGYKISLFDGHPDNIKITTPSDFIIAEMLLRNRQ